MLPDSRVEYCKPPYSIEDLINEKLIGRGLLVPDRTRAEHYLRYIGYYRLGGYLRFFQEKGALDHKYRDGASFDDVLSLYTFDRELRLLAMDAIERVEVAARTVISDVMCLKHGSHWYMDRKHFRGGFNHDGLLNSIRAEIQSQFMKTPFLEHYHRKYREPELPPCWMVAEIMGMGTWSRVYSGLANDDDFNPIARQLGSFAPMVESWLHALTVLRNACAHHACVWNMMFSIKPMTIMIDKAPTKDTSRFFAQAAVLQKFLIKISPQSGWPSRLFELFKKYPRVQISEMGFPSGWYKSPFWGIAKPVNAPNAPTPPETHPTADRSS